MFWIRRYYHVWFVSITNSTNLLETLKDIPEAISTPTPLQGHPDTISVYLRVKKERDLLRVESILKRKVEGTSMEEKWFTGFLSTAAKVRLLNAGKFFVYTFIASAIAAFIATLPSSTSPPEAGIKALYSVGAAVLTALGAFRTIMYIHIPILVSS